VPEIEIKNITEHSGKYLTVIYAQANRSMFSTDDHDLKVKDVKFSKTFGPLSSESVVTASTKLSRDGFGGSFNFIIAVIHDQNEFYWTNADGSEVKYPSTFNVNSTNTLQTKVTAFARNQIPSLSSRGAKISRVTLFLPK